MKTLLVLFVLLASVRVVPAAQYDFSALDKLLQDSVDAADGILNDGYTLVLVQNGDEIFNRSYRNSSDSKVIPIASATKWLSGSVIMSLVDEGLLSLDDRVGTFLPLFTGKKADITIRQLMSHTSGLDTTSSYHLDRDLTLAQAVDSIALNVQLIAEPGTEFAYGGASMQVAGRIAEIVSGKSWDRLFAEKITRPLGMADTDYEGLGRTDNPQIAGGARSSARDYMRFLLMLLNGGVYNGQQILSEEAVRTMHLDQTNGAVIVSSPYGKYSDLDNGIDSTRYGIGNWRERVNPTTGEVITSASQGAFGFSPWIDREHNLAGVLSVRSLGERVMPTYIAMKRLLRDILDTPTEVHPADMPLPALHCAPNPCTNRVVLSFGYTPVSMPNISLVDMSGRTLPVVLTGTPEAVALDVSGISEGLYMITVQTPELTTTAPLVILR